MTVEDPVGLHLAFDVDPATFDQILARLQAAGVPYGSEPGEPDNGRTDLRCAPVASTSPMTPETCTKSCHPHDQAEPTGRVIVRRLIYWIGGRPARRLRARPPRFLVRGAGGSEFVVPDAATVEDLT